jgi:hypothetical protein
VSLFEQTPPSRSPITPLFIRSLHQLLQDVSDFSFLVIRYSKRLNADTKAARGGLIGLLERLVIFFSEVRGQDSNVLSMYRDEPDLYQ